MKDEKNSGAALLMLNWAFEKAVNGGGILGTAQELGEQYLRDNKGDADAAIDALISWQAAKAASGGFVTNLGGIMTLPAAIPANLASSIYIQLRMIAAIAHIRGYNLHEDKVQTCCYLCLVGNGAGNVLKEAGVQIGTRMTTAAIQRYVSGAFLIAVNKAVGFRLVTKAGTTGILNLTKAVPILGGVICGGFDLYATKTIGAFCKTFFVEPESFADCSADKNAGARHKLQEIIALPYKPADKP